MLHTLKKYMTELLLNKNMESIYGNMKNII